MLHTHDYKSIHDFKTLGNHKYENSAFQAEIQQNDRNEPQTHVHQEVADGGGIERADGAQGKHQHDADDRAQQGENDADAHSGVELAAERGKVLWGLDAAADIRFSHENPDVQACYREFLGAPLSPLAEELLHTDHHAWTMPNEEAC